MPIDANAIASKIIADFLAARAKPPETPPSPAIVQSIRQLRPPSNSEPPENEKKTAPNTKRRKQDIKYPARCFVGMPEPRRLASIIVWKLGRTGKVSVRELRRSLGAWRYPHWDSAWKLLLARKAIRVTPTGTRRRIVELVEVPKPLQPKNTVKKPRPRRPRTELFDRLHQQSQQSGASIRELFANPDWQQQHGTVDDSNENREISDDEPRHDIAAELYALAAKYPPRP